MRYTLSILLMFFGYFVKSQVNDVNQQSVWSAFLEVGGVSVGYYTVNGEYLLGKVGKFNVSARAGLGIGTFKEPNWQNDGVKRNYLSIPVGLSAYNFTKSRHHADVGLSLTYFQGTKSNPWGQNRTLTFTPSFGYRYQKPEGGVSFKILYTTNFLIEEFEMVKHFSFGNHVQHGIGLSIGYSFKRKK